MTCEILLETILIMKICYLHHDPQEIYLAVEDARNMQNTEWDRIFAKK